ncbi:MAG: DUF4124 domain-containing protein [Thiobacillus sp.]
MIDILIFVSALKKALRSFGGGLFVIFLAGLASLPAWAGLYKWTDAAGKVHYADQPPITAKSTSLKGVNPAQATTTTEAKQTLDSQDQTYKKRKADADAERVKAEKEAENARIKRENCDKARKNLDTLQKAPRVYSTNAAGQRVYMDDSARMNAEASSRKSISEFCQ